MSDKDKIIKLIAENGIMSAAELATAMGRSTALIYNHLRDLKQSKKIELSHYAKLDGWHHTALWKITSKAAVEMHGKTSLEIDAVKQGMIILKQQLNRIEDLLTTQLALQSQKG